MTKNRNFMFTTLGSKVHENLEFRSPVFGFTRDDNEDSIGIMKLTLPTDTVKIGESVEIGVKGSASSSMRFFMVYETP